jgi:predicted enzyme related to lactoylglutathione lyase
MAQDPDDETRREFLARSAALLSLPAMPALAAGQEANLTKGNTKMAKVLGVGGIFFKAKDPKALSEWYKKWLGVPAKYPNGAFFKPDAMPAHAVTVWSAFDADTKYFEPSNSAFMINLVVDDLDGALKQVVEGGAKLAGKPESSEYGSFGWFIDPEGNKVELWQAPAPK